MAKPKATTSGETDPSDDTHNNEWLSLLKQWDLLKFAKGFESEGWTDPVDWVHMIKSDFDIIGLNRGHTIRFQRYTKQLNQSNGSNIATNKSCTAESLELLGGDGWIELGQFRIGVAVNSNHFSISHKINKKTCVIFRGDGTIHPGPRNDFGLWDMPYIKGLKNVIIGDGWIQLSQTWRIGICDKDHMAIAHLSTKTCMIWRSDGTRHQGPRDDFNGFWDKNNAIKFGTYAVISDDDCKYVKHIQFANNWRIGDVDTDHFSISARKAYFKYDNYCTSVIYRRDGTIHPGPRKDFGLWRNKEKCSLQQLH